MPARLRRSLARLSGASVVAVVLALPGAAAQSAPDAPPVSAPAPARKDPLGRETPRGAVRGFLNAGRSGRPELAVQYLRTSLTGDRATALGQQLFVVLDAR